MNDKTDNHDDDKDFNFFCDFPPFHIFMKNFRGMKPFFDKGLFYKPHGRKFYRGSYKPYTQVSRDEEGYTITMELPGISKEDIHLETTNEELWISAKSTEFDRTYKDHLYFKRPIRSEEVKAHLKAGILTITAPYMDPIPKTKVEVE